MGMGEREREREREVPNFGNPRNVNRFNVGILLKIFKVIKVQSSKIYFTNRFDFFMYSCTALKLSRCFELTVLGLQTVRDLLRHKQVE